MWYALAGVVLFAVAAFAVFRAFQSPKFVARLSLVFAKAVWPLILRAIQPKDLTPEQIQAIREGRDPFAPARRRDEKH